MIPGPIILLNGASSAGKTSILQALQEVLDAPYLNAGIDKFLFMLPDRYLERPLWDEVLGLTTQAGPLGRPGPLGSQLISGMHHAIAALARAGNPVIADHVLIEPCWLRECAQLFCDLPTFFVGVRCPLEILEAREQARGNRTSARPRRSFLLSIPPASMTWKWTPRSSAPGVRPADQAAGAGRSAPCGHALAQSVERPRQTSGLAQAL